MKKTIIMLVILFGVFSHADAAGLKANTLRIGSTGETVKAVQQKLLDLGYSTSKVDGKYGRKTADAVAKFQAAQKLKADGLCGEKTLALVLDTKNPTVLEAKATSSVSGTTTFDSGINEENFAKGPTTLDLAWARTCLDRKPHLQVLSPNGDEVYQAGQQVNVKWRTCNLLSNSLVDILIQHHTPAGGGLAGANYSENLTLDGTVNDGNELVMLPIQYSGRPFGKNFKISITGYPYSINPSFFDVSDNLFTINDSQSVDVCTNIAGIQTSVPNGMFAADSNCYSSQPVDPVCTKDSFIKVVSPNGGEIYQAGQQVTVKWKSCNAGNNMAILLEHYNTNNVLDGGINMTPSNTENDGSEVITLPASIQNPNSNYKIIIVDQRVIPGSSESMHDYSDNSFSINGGIIKPKASLEVSAR